ncbi:MAG: VOC family protein [Bryobacteraceae bacterium]
MPTELTGVTPMLKVLDLRATIDFYTGTLGFEVENLMSDKTGQPNWVSLRRGAAGVMFYSIDQPADGTQAAPSMTGVLCFHPADVKALWSELKNKVVIEWGLQEMEYGITEFAIRDCNGYVLSFGQETNSIPVRTAHHSLGILD